MNCHLRQTNWNDQILSFLKLFQKGVRNVPRIDFMGIEIANIRCENAILILLSLVLLSSFPPFRSTYWGVSGRVVKVVDLGSFAPHRCGFEGSNPARDFGFFHVWNLSSTSMYLFMCLLVAEIMHGAVPEVFLHQ